MEYFKFLPLEITLDILTRLPTESVLDCKLVCKNWGSLVRHPSFSKMHLHRLHDSADDFGKMGFIALTKNRELHYFEYNENHDQSMTPIERIRRFNFTPPLVQCHFLGSCNGLICLVDYLFASVCICNPITKEFVILPKINTDYVVADVYRKCGFGYVSSTNEYKVVDIYMVEKTESVEIHIYTLGSGLGWRNLGNFNPEFRISHLDEAIFANEALYWGSAELEDMIVTFNLVNEKFCEHLSPPPLPPDSYWEIGVLDGFLFISLNLDEEEDECYDVWLLKKKNDNHDMKERAENHALVWSKEFRLDNSRLLAITKSGNVLTYSENYINIYDTQALISERLVDFRKRILEVFPHKITLVSLKELGEEDAKIWESVEVERRQNL